MLGVHSSFTRVRECFEFWFAFGYRHGTRLLLGSKTEAEHRHKLDGFLSDVGDENGLLAKNPTLISSPMRMRILRSI
jgi:hypothetical protein